MSDSSPFPSPARARFGDFPAILFFAVVALAQGFYATFLNHIYYRTQAPFYDSMAYNNDLAQVLTATHEHGLLAGLDRAGHCATVALPYLLAVFAAPFSGPSRALGIWLQIPWVFALLVSCYAMFRIRSKASPGMAAFLALPFVFISIIYSYQGGLSDFRMDLSLYFLSGSAFCWLVIALQTHKLAHWVVCGLFIGLAALARAIAPAYIGMVFCPIVVLRFAFSPADRKRLLLGVLIATIEASLIAGWFYVLRYHDLYYYYFVWNSDAHAHLPLRVSIGHFKFALDSIGRWIFGACLLAVAVTIPWKELRLTDVIKNRASWPWETVFAALIPAGFLAATGAGLNPYVSMPSSFGLLALVLSMRGDWGKIARLRGILAGALISMACVFSAFLGYGRHASLNYNPAAGYRRTLEVMEADSRQHGLASAHFTSISIGNFCTDVLLNMLAFDLGYSRVEGFTASNGTLTMDAARSPLFTSDTYVEWSALPGENDTQRIEYLLKTADSSMDYIFIPSDKALTMLETRRSYNFMNHYARWLRSEILADPAWKPISQEITISPSESYTVYANRSRTRP